MLFLLLALLALSSAQDFEIDHDVDPKRIPMFRIGHTGNLKLLPVKTRPSHHSPLRSKRSIHDHYGRESLSIDLLLIADHSVYEFFRQRSGNRTDVVSAIHDYFSMLVSEVSRIYKSLKGSTWNFRVYCSGIILAKCVEDASESPWIGEPTFAGTNLIDVFSTIKSFRKWVLKTKHILPDHDHAMTFTKMDLSTGLDVSAQGIAYVKSICKIGQAVSVLEDVGAMASVSVAAHELAHSLGADHDGTRDNKDCPHHMNYLMVPSASSTKMLGNSFTFSPCTVDQIEAHLKAKMNRTGAMNCLHRSLSVPQDIYGSTRRRRRGRKRRKMISLPGQRYDVQHQCTQAFGLKCKFCERMRRDVCHRVWCQDSVVENYGSCYSKHYMPALYGTSCGHKMWCINGACIEDQMAPAQTECHGDRDKKFCENLICANPKQFCRIATFRRFCCKSCVDSMQLGSIWKKHRCSK